MLFAALCTDKPDSLALRMETRPAHVAFLTDLNETGILKMAGPFLDSDAKPNGSLVIVEAETIEEARAILSGDPYAKVGLFADVTVKPFNWTFNNPHA